MRKLTKPFFIAIISLLLFSGMAASTSSQATGADLYKPADAACWSVVPSPNVGTSSGLAGVAAISSSDVWAVGNSGYYQSTLIEHWNGSSWSVVPSPSPGTNNNLLHGVTAISPSDVWAVGSYNSGSGSTLVEHWNGTSWSVVPSPNVGTTENSLDRVAATSPSDVWAVGGYLGSGVYQTLIEHWNGSSWSVVSSPDVGAGPNQLLAVTAISPSDVWAVGAYDNGSIGSTLVEHWNGTSWSVVPSPNLGTGDNYLYSVAAISPSDVWAVGHYRNGSVFNTLTEHWNGSSWSVISSPNSGTFDNLLYGVTAISPSDVWVVGAYDNGSGSAYQTLTEHWNGTNWSVVPSPSPGNSDNYLYSVAAISPSDAWAVGNYYNGSVRSTLVEHYSASGCATPTPGGPTNTPALTNTPQPSSTPQPTVCPNPFVDINGNIFFHAINYLYCNGVVNGTDPAHYSPAGTSTRGQFAKVVVLGFGLPFYTPRNGQTFTDVPPSYFAYTYIETGYHAGILSGFDANGCAAHGATYPCYLPNIPITRGQLTKLVVGAAHYPLYTPTGGNPSFSDVPASNIFFAFIETAHYKGVINGYPDGTFRPNNNIRRDEMAQIVFKAITSP